MDIQEKYFETMERLFDDKIEIFRVNGKHNDYRVVKTTMGAWDENDDECIGIGAEVEIAEIREHRSDIIEYIRREYEDDYDFTENTIPGVMNDNGEWQEGEYHSIYTQIYTDPGDVESFVNNVLETLEKIA